MPDTVPIQRRYSAIQQIQCIAGALSSCWRAASSGLRPRIFLPLLALYIVFIKVVSRPDLKDGAGWQFFSQHDWGIVALRRYLRLRLHVSAGLRASDASKPVVIAIHPHGVACDFCVAIMAYL